MDLLAGLADSDNHLIGLAVKLWREGYPSKMRKNARERALFFDKRNVAKEFMKLIFKV